MKNIAVILAGGVGSRMGLDIPKQYVEVSGKPVVGYCIDVMLNHESVDCIIIGVADCWKTYVEKYVSQSDVTKPVYYAKPGETRQESILNTLEVIKSIGAEDGDVVLIHDGARPMVSKEIVSRCLEATLSADAVLPVVPMKDTVYMSNDGRHIDSLIERRTLWRGQAPEAFRFGPYYNINKSMSRGELAKITGSTEIAYRAGMNCVLVEGAESNFKITTPEDLSHFEKLIMDESL